jgi:dynein heavy chain
MNKYFSSSGLVISEQLILKSLQLFETIKVRHGVIIVGATLCCKSVILDCVSYCIQQALSHEDNIDFVLKKIKKYKLNPKSISQGLLYGIY